MARISPLSFSPPTPPTLPASPTSSASWPRSSHSMSGPGPRGGGRAVSAESSPPERSRSAVATFQAVVHLQGRGGLARAADGGGGHTGDDGVGGNILEHHRARSHLGTVADVDVAEHRGAGAEQDAAAHLGVAVAVLLARPAQDD